MGIKNWWRSMTGPTRANLPESRRRRRTGPCRVPTGSATLSGTIATFTVDGIAETITFAQSGGDLTHNLVGGGFVNQFDARREE